MHVLLVKQMLAAVSARHPHFIHTHTDSDTHTVLYFFNSFCVPDRNGSKPISDSPLESHYFFWHSSCTNSTWVFSYTEGMWAVRGNVPDHFKAGLLLLDGFIPFKSQERGRMNGKGPYSRKVKLGKQ